MLNPNRLKSQTKDLYAHVIGALKTATNEALGTVNTPLHNKNTITWNEELE